jgi:hypothetical protein
VSRLPAPKRRFLIEVRGVLHVDAPDGDTARRAVEQWVEALRKGETPEPAAGITVGWLRVWPERDEGTDWRANED